MDLLPRSRDEFKTKQYWNTFFEKRNKKGFEWYGEYNELCEYLHKYIKNSDSILVVGCGNSKLSSDLYDVGYSKITNIDISPVAIKQMSVQNQNRDQMNFIQMDVTQMTFQDSEFSVVLDKGTLDALMPDEEESTLKTINAMFDQIERVLRIGGRYVCISLLQEQIIKHLLIFFTRPGWMFRVIRCLEIENSENSPSHLPVFMIVCTKCKPMPMQIIELCHGSNTNRVDVETLKQEVANIQKTAMICHALSRTTIAESDEIAMDLFKQDQHLPRYSIYVLDDNTKRKNQGKFAVFIVPQGREMEWLFSTPEGRRHLLESTVYSRLAIVVLHRGQTYGNLDVINSEISACVKSLAPSTCQKDIPYISLGSDSGKRNILCEKNSEISGKFVVEDVETETGELFRRLIFLSNQNLIQSEAKLKKMKLKNREQLVVDTGYLACDHHRYMITATNLVCIESEANRAKNILVIGLGGGGLCNFLKKILVNAKIHAIDIDPEVVQVATEYFGLDLGKSKANKGSDLEISVADGLTFIHEERKQRCLFYDAILFDVNSNDPSLGMSCPPKSFLEIEILKDIYEILSEKGIFIVNLVCRDSVLRCEVLKKLISVFPSYASYKLKFDQNEVIFCSKHNYEWSKDLESTTKLLNQRAKKLQMCDKNEDIVDLDFLSEIKTKL